MKTTLLRFLPLLVAGATMTSVMWMGPNAEAAVVETLQGMSPESVQQRITAWLAVLGVVLTGVTGLGSTAIVAYFSLRKQINDQAAKLDRQDAKLDVHTVQIAQVAAVPSVASGIRAAPSAPPPGVPS